MDRRWNKNTISLLSSVTSVIRLPTLEPVQQPSGSMSRQFQWQLGRRGEYPQDHNTWRTYWQPLYRLRLLDGMRCLVNVNYYYYYYYYSKVRYARMGRHMSPSTVPLIVGDHEPQLISGLLGHMNLPSNGISIGSSVSAQLAWVPNRHTALSTDTSLRYLTLKL